MSVQSIVDQMVLNPTPAAMDAVVSAFKASNVEDADIAYLATRLAKSGELLSKFDNQLVADVASTGGPSSLSTVLCPLYLARGGAIVPTLGVPGRPAGGTDILACVHGFTSSL